MVNVARPIGELDLHLFGEGTHRRLWELLGPQPLHVDAGGAMVGVRFAVWAPNARAVSVVGEEAGWPPVALVPIETDVPTGIWSGAVPGARSGHRYRYEITTAAGEVLRRADPVARCAEPQATGASIVPDAFDHEWGDHEWMATRGAVLAGTSPLRIYQVLAGPWRDGVENWDRLAADVADHVGGLGFTHVELLGMTEHAGGVSRGVEVVGYYAPTSRLGDPAGLRRFVDVLHRRGLGVIVGVPNRVAGCLARFDGAPLYEHPDTPEGSASVPFDHGRNEVRNFLVANALYWLDEFHVDALRLGGSEGAAEASLVQHLTAVVGEEFPDALVIDAAAIARPGATRGVDVGGLGCSHAWNLRWRHDTLAYLSVDPAERPAHHDLMTASMPFMHDERFVLPLGHDDVGSRTVSLLSTMPGDEVQRMATLRLFVAWQWASPGAPLVSMGADLAASDDCDARWPLPWHLLDRPEHRGVHDLIAHVNDVADRWPALWRRDADPAGFQWLDAHDAEHARFAFVRWDLDGAAAVVCIANCSADPCPEYRVGLPWAGRWDVVVDTAAPRWCGDGAPQVSFVAGSEDPWHGYGSSARLDLAPVSMVWLAAPSPG